MRYIKLVACLVATLFTAVAFTLAASAQTDATIQDSSSHSSVGYVYVSSNPSGNNYEINAFAAASNGKLTPVSGSPFRVGYVGSMAVNAKYLFVSDTVYIYTFAIASDGAIKQVASINAQQYNGNNCGGPSALFLDHTAHNIV